MDVLIYEWTYEHPNFIVGFGCFEKENIAIVIKDFYPYIYILKDSFLPSSMFLKMEEKKIKFLRGAYSQNWKDVLKISFASIHQMEEFVKSCNSIGIEIFEEDVPIEEKFLLDKKIRRVDTIHIKSFTKEEPITTSRKEYHCLSEDITQVDVVVEYQPLILCMDIEAYSSSKNKMPDPDLELNKTFMISIVLWRYKESNHKKYLLYCCDTEIHIPDVQVRKSSSEISMILDYFDLINELNPDIITGYNIFKFDFEYLRCRLKRKLISIPNTSRIIKGETEEKEMRWYSSAYGHNDYLILESKGRCNFDLYQYISREYKLSEYSLSFVSSYFIGDTKSDLDVTTMFSLYLKGDRESIERIAEYCIQDSMLVMRLFDELDVWITLIELSKVTGISPKDLYTRGQQLRVLSLLRRECRDLGFLLTTPESSMRSNYEGAYVVEPIPGIYRQCFSLDFSSLYPSIIIGYNICYSTLVSSCDNNEDCHVVEISPDKIYYFLKKPPGVVPHLLEKLVSERKTTREKIKTEVKSTIISTLDKRQWALKISANSVYGSYGTRNEPRLQFMEGAECTTALGRKSVKRAIEIIENNYEAKVIYGDTDSCIVSMKENVDENFVKNIAKETSSYFPEPLRLELENIYESFLIASKKRYAGIIKGSKKLILKGLVPARRDRCEFVRSLYQKLLIIILEGESKENVYSCVFHHIINMINGNIDMKDMIIRRSLGSSYKVSSNPQLVFANKLRDRGEIVEPGTRLEFVFTKTQKRLQGEKMELVSNVTFDDIDFDYYIEKHIAPPIDDLLQVAGMEPYVSMLSTCLRM